MIFLFIVFAKHFVHKINVFIFVYQIGLEVHSCKDVDFDSF